MGIKNKNNITLEILENDVFLVSYPKSGRTWVRFLIGNYLSGNQLDFPNSYQKLIPDIDYNPQQCCQLKKPRFIQSHWSYTPEFKRVVYIVRDGRDVAVSYYFHALKFNQIQKNASFENFLEIFNTVGLGNLPTWSNHVDSWLNQVQTEQKLLLIKYEDLTRNTIAELIKILEFAELNVDNVVAKTAVEMSQFDKLQDYEKKQEQISFKDITDSDLNFKFFRRGKIGDYKNYFDQRLMENFIKYHGSTLKRLDYLNNYDSKLNSTKYYKIVNELGAVSSEMTDANNQEINVDELIQKIRNEVARHQNISPSLEAKPVTASSGTNTTTMSYIETLLNEADLYSQVPTEFPEKFTHFPFNFSKNLQKFLLKVYGFLFKKQRVVNSSLSQALRESLALNQRLINQINSLQEQLNGIGNRVTVTEGRISEFNYHLNATNAGLADIGNRVTVTEGRLVEMKHYLGATNEGLTEISDRLTSTEAQIENMNKQLEDIDQCLTIMDESHVRNDSYLKNDLSQQKRLITMFLEEARQRLPEPFNSQQLQNFSNEDQHSLDALYVAFEERFRGSRDVILNRLKIYLPLIDEAKIGTPESPILDVGCGRGEWLELLQESGYNASGIDISKVMLEQCQARGLEVREGDVISYLQSLPDASLGAVTGFHIIEHIPIASLIKLFDEVIRVLKSSGIIIFETPNPRNVLVGSGDFYRDPTHLNPIHPDTISYIATLKGFINSESYFFEEKESGVELLPSSKMRFDKFDNYVTVSRDFVLIAHKP